MQSAEIEYSLLTIFLYTFIILKPAKSKDNCYAFHVQIIPI